VSDLLTTELLLSVSGAPNPDDGHSLTPTVVNFIQQPLPTSGPFPAAGAAGSEQAGALGMGQQASTGLVQFNSFFSYVMPLIGKTPAPRRHKLH
jgi:hypothetical protein